MKRFRYLEGIAKGFANHRRIEILALLEKTPELSLSEVSEAVGVDFRTAGEHMHKLVASGLVMKRNAGKAVRHAVTPLGHKVLRFCRTLE
ncbi:MAG: hypothetical protein UY71_C0043G0001 [Parcubacteria group bacterium GW2011_GWB1_52_7]|nr:MAG: hypothetical protein UY71_C0043G0001 [Parcubacteria group bacterium GW2011_GWB1_52_7]